MNRLKRPPQGRGRRSHDRLSASAIGPSGSSRAVKKLEEASFKKHGLRLVIGKRAVSEVLRGQTHSTPIEILVTDEQRPWINEFPEGLSIPTRTVTFDALSKLAESSHHQGLGILVRPASGNKLKSLLEDWKEEEQVVVLAVDAVTDPGNFGAILRASECFGASGVIYSKNRCAPITSSVTKASAGASEILPLIEVSNLHQALLECASFHFSIVSAALTAQSQSLSDFSFPSHTVIVVGAEGRGISDLILRTSHFHVKIPMRGAIESLNVSQACAVFLSAFWK